MPWVPRDLYDELVATLREKREAKPSPSVQVQRPFETSGYITTNPTASTAGTTLTTATIPAGSLNGWVTLNKPMGEPSPVAEAPAPAAPTLSDAVYRACVYYANGDREERAANLRVAQQMLDSGESEMAIMAAIKQGAAMPHWPTLRS